MSEGRPVLPSQVFSTITMSRLLAIPGAKQLSQPTITGKGFWVTPLTNIPFRVHSISRTPDTVIVTVLSGGESRLFDSSGWIEIEFKQSSPNIQEHFTGNQRWGGLPRDMIEDVCAVSAWKLSVLLLMTLTDNFKAWDPAGYIGDSKTGNPSGWFMVDQPTSNKMALSKPHLQQAYANFHGSNRELAMGVYTHRRWRPNQSCHHWWWICDTPL